MAQSSGHLLAGRYRTIKRLGSGGMATVLLAEDERLGREVAVKRMHAESPDEVAKRFKREAQLGASLNHPNVVSVFDIETDDENVLIVMEYVSGGTLKDALARGPLPRDAAFKVLRGVAAAIDYAHDHDIVHRDIKPANVLLDADGRAKLADLGIATAAEVTSITATGSVLGTASYMPPERLDGEAGGKEADIYALATVAYETLTGHKARQGRSAVEIAAMVMSDPPPDLRVHVPDAPGEAAGVLERGMARDPAERPRSAGELVRDLCTAFERAEEDEPEPVEEPQDARAAPVAAAALPDTRGADADGTPAAAPAPTYRRQHATRGRSAAPARRPGAGSPDRRWLVPVAALVVALLAVGLVLALSGGGEESGGDGGSASEDSGDVRGQDAEGGGEGGGSAEPGGGGSGGTGEAGGDGGSGATGGGTAGGSDAPPAQAVEQLYTRAADDDFEGAWELAGPGVRRQLGGFDRFKATLDTLESIEFRTLEVTDQSGDTATVRLQTVATHTNKVDRCRGTARTASSGGRWRVERLNVQCTEG